VTIRWNDWQLGAAGVYLVLMTTNALTFWRSLAFGVAALLAVLLLIRTLHTAPLRVTRAPVAISIAFAFWCLWATASLAWSVHPEYSADQLRREVGWTLIAVLIFAIASRDARSWRRLVATALLSFACLAALSGILMLGAPGPWDASAYHGGVGQWSTFLVLVAPLMLTLLAGAPVGFANGTRSLLAALVLMVLLLASARATENRMVWVALAVVFAVASLLGGLRWHATLRKKPLRWLLPIVGLLFALGMLFATAARDKAQLHFPPDTTVAQTLAGDPRIALWNHTIERLRERPWLGFGFGRAIIGDELREALHDPLLAHAHNVFVSQWLQTGAIGFASFCALLATLLWRYFAWVRSDDDATAVLGIVGVALVAGFVVKNLTDDFFFGSNAKEFWTFNVMLLGYGVRAHRLAEKAPAAPASG
jgi:O-antigen ligase